VTAHPTTRGNDRPAPLRERSW